MEGYGRPGDPWDRGNPPSWDREAFQRDWFDRERGVQPNTWEGQAGAPVETWDKRGVPRDVEFASAADQPWERGRMVELDQGAGQWDREERPLAREAPRREDRFDERERHGGRDPYYERERGNDRERPREADLGRSRRSHSSERSRGRSRDRDSRREYRRRSRSRSRSRSRERRRERDEERRRRNTAEPEPSTIIMMRNLRSSVTEDDISKVLGDKHSLLREVRLIRDRGGTSKGFAFLEFFRIEDARTWLESNKNDFFLQGGQVSLEYSRQRFHDRDRHGRDDWTCFKCNTRNFRNIYCSTCECSRHESESLSDERGRDPAKSLERESNPPSQILILKGLDHHTSEESVRQALQAVTSLPIQDIRVIKDKISGMGRGFCFVDLASIEIATDMLKTLRSQAPAFFVDGRRVYANFARGQSQSEKSYSSSLASAAIAAAAAMQQSGPSYYSSKSGHQDYAQQGGSGSEGVMGDRAASDGAQESRMAGEGAEAQGPKVTLANGAVIHLPATYSLDATSGYYYDSATGLYYDPNSGYYYNSATSQYCYYDATTQQYVPIDNTASGGSTGQEEGEQQLEGGQKKKKKEKEAAVAMSSGTPSAKKIMKDMERWAKKQQKQSKSLQPQPELEKEGEEPEVVKPGMGLSFGFTQSVSLSKNPSLLASGSAEGDLTEMEMPNLLADTVVEPAPEPSLPPSSDHDPAHTDWSQLACLLCKRKFENKDKLLKHQQFSSLHKENLEKERQPKPSVSAEIKYRDRAKERREKHGRIEPIIPKWKRDYDEERIDSSSGTVSVVEPVSAPEEAPAVAENKGNKLLHAMGWSEGQGLGRNNQGITAPIEAERRQRSVGLGSKSLDYELTGVHTYMTAVKRMTAARWKMLEDDK